MLVYLAGPMSNTKDYNREAFEQEAARLEAYGYEVYNPRVSSSSRYIVGKITKQEMIAEQMGKIAEADAICLLPGWQGSQGARKELQLALMLDKEILLAK